MSYLYLIPKKEHLIRDAYQDFILSKKAALLSPRTIEFYEYTVGDFIEFLRTQDINNPELIRSLHAREYITRVSEREASDATVHAHARGIRAFLRFGYSEGYMPNLVSFAIPKVEQKRQRVLSINEVKKVIESCRRLRDKALVLLLVDTGLRASEALALNWEDIDLSSGLIKIQQGKGKKDRSVVVGMRTRRAILKYRRCISHDYADPVIQTLYGTRLKQAGLRMILERLGNRVGIHLNPHLLRRTFATLSLRAGINPLYLQALMGHASLEMTRKYIGMVEDDLLDAHRDVPCQSL